MILFCHGAMIQEKIIRRELNMKVSNICMHQGVIYSSRSKVPHYIVDISIYSIQSLSSYQFYLFKCHFLKYGKHWIASTQEGKIRKKKKKREERKEKKENRLLSLDKAKCTIYYDEYAKHET